MRRFSIAVLVAAAVGSVLTAAPARAAETFANCTATACHFDVPPGSYDVKVVLGGDTASSTSIAGETRRALLPETAVPAGERIARSFTVDVRTPEGEPTGAEGTPAWTCDWEARPRHSPTSRSLRHGGPGRSSWSATPPSATSPATRTPAGASSFRNTCARACPSPTTPTPVRARSVTSPMPACGRPSGR